MSFSYKILNQDLPHFITATIVDWIDVFSRQVYRDIVIENMNYCINNKGMIVFGYVIMTNHIHMIVQSRNGKLSNLLRDFKKFTARRILLAIQTEPESRREWMLGRYRLAAGKNRATSTFQVWQHGNHAEEIFSESFLWSKLDYIHLNPVRAGIVEKASYYKYSSASNYVNGSGILEKVEIVDPLVVDTSKPGGVVRFFSY